MPRGIPSTRTRQRREIVRQRKKLFIRALAEYLVGDQTRLSIELEMGKPHAREWATLRSKTPLIGYPTVDEAEQVLADFLGG